MLALNAGRVVPVGSLAGQLWPDDPPGNPGNALQTLVSRLRAELRQAGPGDVIESHPAGYRLAVPLADSDEGEEFAARAPDPDGGRIYRRLMTSLEAAPGVLGWGEPAVAQARAASRGPSGVGAAG